MCQVCVVTVFSCSERPHWDAYVHLSQCSSKHVFTTVDFPIDMQSMWRKFERISLSGDYTKPKAKLVHCYNYFFNGLPSIYIRTMLLMLPHTILCLMHVQITTKFEWDLLISSANLILRLTCFHLNYGLKHRLQYIEQQMPQKLFISIFLVNLIYHICLSTFFWRGEAAVKQQSLTYIIINSLNTCVKKLLLKEADVHILPDYGRNIL